MHTTEKRIALVEWKKCNKCHEKKPLNEFRPKCNMPCAQCCRDDEREARLAKKRYIKLMENANRELEEFVRELMRDDCELRKDNRMLRKDNRVLRKENHELRKKMDELGF